MRLLLLMTACWLGLAAAQDGYSVVIEGPFKDALYDVVEDYDGEISVVGFSQHFPQKRSEPQSYYNAFDYLADAAKPKGEQIRLIGLDASGATTRDHSFNLPEFNRAVSVVKHPDGGYVVGGSLQNGQMLLGAVAPDGQIRYTKRFGTRNTDRMKRLIPLRDGGYLAVGTSVTSRNNADDPFTQGLGGSDISLTRFDKHGESIWSRKYGTGNDDRGVSAAEAYDGSLMILGTTESDAMRQAFLMRLDENGESVWSREYDAGTYCNAYDLIGAGGDRFAAALTRQDAAGKEQIRIVTFDLQQNIVTDHEIPTQASAALYDLAQRQDGSLVGVGAITDTAAGTTDGLALSLSSSGTLQWRKQFGDANRDLFRSVAIQRDGSLVAVGERVAPGSEIVDMWVVKLFDDGSLMPKARTDEQAKESAAPSSPFETAKSATESRGDAKQQSRSPFETAKAPANGQEFSSKATGMDGASKYEAPDSQFANADDAALYATLHSAFADEIANNNVTLTKDLRIVFSHPVLLFNVGVYKLTPVQENFLGRFSHTLLSALQPFKAHIEAIRVNGHTSSEWRGADFNDRYLNNMELSTQRAFSVLSHIFREPENAPYRKWLTDILSNDGYSYAKIVKNPEEDRKASRRVTFEIVLK